MTFNRFTELFCQMIYEISGNQVDSNSLVGDDFDDLDLIEAECRFDQEYRVLLNTDNIVYDGELSTILLQIYNNNSHELINLNI